jgi:hypothetical protein
VQCGLQVLGPERPSCPSARRHARPARLHRGHTPVAVLCDHPRPTLKTNGSPARALEVIRMVASDASVAPTPPLSPCFGASCRYRSATCAASSGATLRVALAYLGEVVRQTWSTRESLDVSKGRGRAGVPLTPPCFWSDWSFREAATCRANVGLENVAAGAVKAEDSRSDRVPRFGDG